MCVSNTYGPGDYLPDPHGGLIAAAIRGAMPFYIDGAASEVVGVEDAARALILAATHGKDAGDIISERFMTAKEIYDTACAAVGVQPPRRGVPLAAMSAMGVLTQFVSRLRGRESRLSPLTVRLMRTMSPMDHSKACRDLGWEPNATRTNAIAEAAAFFRSQRPSAARPQ